MRTASVKASDAAFVRVMDRTQGVGVCWQDSLALATLDVLPITVGATFTTAAPVRCRMADPPGCRICLLPSRNWALQFPRLVALTINRRFQAVGI